MKIRKNIGLLIILASIGGTLIGFLFSTYDARKNILDNIMRSQVILLYPDCKVDGGSFGCFQVDADTGLSVPYRWLVALGFVGLLAGIYFSSTTRQAD